jgi:hypothetical protein
MRSVKSTFGQKSAVWDNDDCSSKKSQIMNKIFSHNYASDDAPSLDVKRALRKLKNRSTHSNTEFEQPGALTKQSLSVPLKKEAHTSLRTPKYQVDKILRY